MPQQCWAYTLAFLANAVLAYYWQGRRFAAPHRGWFGKYAAAPLTAVLTTSGGVFLSYWKVEELGPVIGVFWLFGFVVGAGLRYYHTARTLFHAAGTAGLSRRERQRVFHTIAWHLTAQGTDGALSKARTVANNIRTAHKKELADDRARLREEIASLKATVKAAHVQHESARTAADARQRELTLVCGKLKEALGRAVALSAEASIYSARCTGRWPLRNIMKVQLKGIIAILGDTTQLRACFYWFGPLPSNAVGAPVVTCVARGGDESFPPVRRLESLEGAALVSCRDFHWPDDAETFAKGTVTENYDPTRDPWPKRWYIPIPYLADRSATWGAPDPYGVIRIDACAGYQWPKTDSELQLAALSLAVLTDSLLAHSKAHERASQAQ